MKLLKTLILAALLAGGFIGARGQSIVSPNPGLYGLSYNRGAFPYTLWLPTGCGVPVGKASLNSTAINNPRLAAIFADTCGHHIYWYHPNDSSWSRIDTGGGGGGSGTVTGVLISNDSLYYATSSGNTFVALLITQADSTVKYVTPSQLNANIMTVSNDQSDPSADTLLYWASGNTVARRIQDTSTDGTVTITKTYSTPGTVVYNLHAASGFSNPMTTAGDLIVGGSGGFPGRLSIGANTYVLTSNGSAVSWQPSTGAVTSVNDNGGGTLTFSPSTGAVLGTVNLGATFTWSGLHTFNGGLDLGSNLLFTTNGIYTIGNSTNNAKSVNAHQFISNGSRSDVVAASNWYVYRVNTTVVDSLAATGQRFWPPYINNAFPGTVTGAHPDSVLTINNGAINVVPASAIGGSGGIAQVYSRAAPITIGGTDSVGINLPTYIGTLYAANNWTTLSPFTVTATAALSGGKIQLSGGTSLTDTTHYISLTDTSYWDYWHRQATFTAPAKSGTNGASLGSRSTNVNSPTSVYATFDGSGDGNTGTVALYSAGTLLIRTSALTYTAGDTLTLDIERKLDTTYIRLIDDMSGAPGEVATKWIWNINQPGSSGAGYYENTGVTTVWSTSSTVITLDSLGMSSTEIKNPSGLLGGDSKLHYYQGNFYTSVPMQLNAKYGQVVANGGPGDRTQDMISRLWQIYLINPSWVGMMVGSNDYANETLFQTNFAYIYNALVAHGIKVVVFSPFYESARNMLSEYNWEKANYAGPNWVDVYYAIKNGSGMLYGDGTHITQHGADTIVQTAIASNAIPAGVKNLPAPPIVNAPAYAIPKIINTPNILGPSSITDLGDSIRATEPLAIPRVVLSGAAGTYPALYFGDQSTGVLNYALIGSGGYLDFLKVSGSGVLAQMNTSGQWVMNATTSTLAIGSGVGFSATIPLTVSSTNSSNVVGLFNGQVQIKNPSTGNYAALYVADQTANTTAAGIALYKPSSNYAEMTVGSSSIYYFNSSSTAIGIGAVPNAATILDMPSTTQGIRIPVMTSTQFKAIAALNGNQAIFSDSGYRQGLYNGSAYVTYITNDIFSGTLGSYAPLASPTFGGTPAAPTASYGTNTTQLATTAFVQAAYPSGSFTCTPSNTTNVSAATVTDAYYSQNNQIVTVTVSGSVTTTTALLNSQITITLPISTTQTGLHTYGSCAVDFTGSSPNLSSAGVVQLASSTTVLLDFPAPSTAGNSLFTTTFQYHL
jgi:hypothetical protein